MKKSMLTFSLLFAISVAFSQIQKVTIPSDDIALNAYVYEAQGDNPKPTIIWCHGNPGGKVKGESKFAMRLNDKRINVLRFNYRGLWGTKGIYTPGNSQRDLKNVLDFILQDQNISKFNIDPQRIIVAGYSHGSNVTIVSALHDDRIKEFICLGLADFSYLIREFFNTENEGMRAFFQISKEAIWESGMAPNYEEYFLDMMFNNYHYNFVAQAEKLKNKRMYFVVGTNDITVPVENHFFPLYRELKKIGHSDFQVDITESDHGFSDLFTGRFSEMIAIWINKK